MEAAAADPPLGPRAPRQLLNPRRLLHVPARIHDQFWREWSAINRVYPLLDDAPEGVSLEVHWVNLAALREVAREELRRATLAAIASTREEDLGAEKVLAL